MKRTYPNPLCLAGTLATPFCSVARGGRRRATGRRTWSIRTVKRLLPFLLIAPAYGADWSEHPYDVYSHIALGGVISCAVTAKTERPLYGVLSGLVAGAVKEATDDRFDGVDFASWGVGGAVGMICIKF
jgi:hypothetical protein